MLYRVLGGAGGREGSNEKKTCEMLYRVLGGAGGGGGGTRITPFSYVVPCTRRLHVCGGDDGLGRFAVFAAVEPGGSGGS